MINREGYGPELREEGCIYMIIRKMYLRKRIRNISCLPT